MKRSRLTTRLRIASLIAILTASLTTSLIATPASATSVANLVATFRDGQTFLTWDDLPGTGWIYHVMSSSTPIDDAASLDNASELAQVGDNSAVDQRITSLVGATLTYRISPTDPPLAATKGLFVATPTIGALTYYAVTVEKIGMGQDLSLVPGRNTLTSPVWERVQRPQPVWQRTLTSPTGEDYVLWTTNSPSTLMPAMCNLPGRAFHFGIVQGTAGGALIVTGHGRGGNFLNSIFGSGTPGEWVLSIDDYLPTGDLSSFYFGYEQNYDLEQPYNFPRATGGLVNDFTEQRVMFLLDWADQAIPHDPKRVYAMGVSMGGSFAFFMAWHHPDRIAGTLSVIPKVCTGYRPDVFPGLRDSFDRMWGSPDIDLPTTTGARVFQWMDGREQARIERHRGSAPMVAFCGINDTVTGWAEKVAYFQSMQANDAGGTWFWDERGHYDASNTAEWYPMMGAKLLYKYRLDQSYPAFTNCSSNGNFGNGDATTADPIGQINGLVDWDETAMLDTQLRWEVTLKTRSVSTLDGIIGAPPSLNVDVTPRRLQTFIVAQNVLYRFEVRRRADGVLIQAGTASADQDAMLTLPQVQVVDGGVRLAVFPTTTAGVTPETSGRGVPHLALSRNPVQDKASLTIEWPGEGDGVVELFDMQGRRVRTEFAGSAKGLTERTFRTADLSPGLYVLSARQGTAKALRRVTVIH
jgi:pimeloyl-ACP methyl ester carboxylesterase